jgi:hypothetical protein
MNDANGHVLNINDVVHPDNASEMILRIDEFDGSLATCRFKDALIGPGIKFAPAHLIYISTPA